MDLADELERLHEAVERCGRSGAEVGAIAYILADRAPHPLAAHPEGE